MIVKRNQTAVYWPPTGVDGYGQTTFDTPIEVAVRWEDKQERFISKEGVEHTSSSVVYPASALILGGYLWLGLLSSLSSSEEDDPFSVTGAKEIKSVNESPSLSGNSVFWKVFL